MLNYDDLENSLESTQEIRSPREIYVSLPNKDPRFSYPRDVQGMVWSQWHERRSEKDLVIKLNTGGGKTVVGLILLQACLEEKQGPVVYVTPNPQLTVQAINEARSLGLQVCDDPKDERFQSGQAILVVNIHKLVNGQSVFGVQGGWRDVITIGSIVFDDAHACLETIEEQFSLKIPRKLNDLYDQILALFSEDLTQQNPTRIQEIIECAPNRSMLVPFWTWKAKLPRVIELLVKHREHKDLRYQYPLVNDHLRQCSCVVSEDAIEITPHAVPITKLPSIANAKRRIFMSATLADDGALSSHFGVSAEAIRSPIVPESAGDVGDRLFLTPSLIDRESDRDEVKEMLERLAENFNVVVIVPSESKAQFWKDSAEEVLSKNNVEAGLERLRNQHVGLVILINRYDGIDLPDNACRVLVLDGLPDVRREIDVIRQGYLQGSQKVLAQVAQRIEQGAGRGVRSSDDYCAVLLMGENLCAQVHTAGVREKFSPATKKQFKLSDLATKQISKVSEIEKVIREDFMNRGSQWAKMSRNAVSAIKYSKPEVDKIAVATREAFDSAANGDLSSATQTIRELVEKLDDPIEKGFGRQMLAEYLDAKDSVAAQKQLMRAKTENSALLLPMDGISLVKLKEPTNQAADCLRHLQQSYPSGNHLIVAMNSLLSDLVFDEDRVPQFEAAMKNLAPLLGFIGQRPETETGKGPDVFWRMGKGEHLIIECKSGSVTQTIKKRDAGQLGVSAAWFEEGFGPDMQGYPVMIHNVRTLAKDAALDSQARIIDRDTFDSFKKVVTSFLKSLAESFDDLRVENVMERLQTHNLTPKTLVQKFLKRPRR